MAQLGLRRKRFPPHLPPPTTRYAHIARAFAFTVKWRQDWILLIRESKCNLFLQIVTRFAHRNEELIKICLARGFVAQLIKAPNYSSGCSSKPDIFSGWFCFLTKTRESEVEETWTLATAKISFSLVIMGSTNKLTQFPAWREVWNSLSKVSSCMG